MAYRGRGYRGGRTTRRGQRRGNSMRMQNRGFGRPYQLKPSGNIVSPPCPPKCIFMYGDCYCPQSY